MNCHRTTTRRIAPRRIAPHSRRGFTLIEVITALTLTAIVVTIAALALGAARDAGASVARHQGTLEAESRWRAAVADMLRYAPRADAINEPLLRIDNSAAGSRLVFLSQGVVQPFGTGRVWRVAVWESVDGVQLDAEAIGRGPALAPLHTTLTHLPHLVVSAFENDGGIAWRSDWPVERSRPAMVRLAFPAADGTAMAPPMLVSLLVPGGGTTGLVP